MTDDAPHAGPVTADGPAGAFGGDQPEAAAMAGVRFPVDLPQFQGPLEELVLRAQRGDIDLATVPVSAITSQYRAQVIGADPRPDPREVADFLTLAARLLQLKAARLLPDGSLEPPADEPEAAGEVDDPGARLAEYRLFKAAAEALLSELADGGARSFLGLVAAEVVPVERLTIPPERLAAAFRAVLERLPEIEPFRVGTRTFSVEEKLSVLREMLVERRSLRFDDVFAGVATRLEAIACFLALLELLKVGEARVDQPQPFGDIVVSALHAAAPFPGP